jgi:DNA-binding IclR family transcriptional regulator
VQWRPTSLNHVVERTGVPVAVASRMLDFLEQAGFIRRDGDWWVRGADGNLGR